MKPIFLCALLVGCAASGDDYPVQPGSGPTSTGGSNSPAMISGRVCVVADPRFLDTCATSDAGGINVALGGATTTTASDGSFTIGGSSSSAGGFQVTGTNVIPVSMPVSAAPMIPVLRADLFSQMLAANGIVLTSGSGSILGTVVRAGGVPAVNMGVRSTPSPAFGPFFDGSTPTAWQLNGTGARGVFWAPGVTTGTASVTLTDLATSTETTVDGIQVINGGITIVDTILP